MQSPTNQLELLQSQQGQSPPQETTNSASRYHNLVQEEPLQKYGVLIPNIEEIPEEFYARPMIEQVHLTRPNQNKISEFLVTLKDSVDNLGRWICVSNMDPVTNWIPNITAKIMEYNQQQSETISFRALLEEPYPYIRQITEDENRALYQYSLPTGDVFVWDSISSLPKKETVPANPLPNALPFIHQNLTANNCCTISSLQGKAETVVAYLNENLNMKTVIITENIRHFSDILHSHFLSEFTVYDGNETTKRLIRQYATYSCIIVSKTTFYSDRKYFSTCDLLVCDEMKRSPAPQIKTILLSNALIQGPFTLVVDPIPPYLLLTVDQKIDFIRKSIAEKTVTVFCSEELPINVKRLPITSDIVHQTPNELAIVWNPGYPVRAKNCVYLVEPYSPGHSWCSSMGLPIDIIYTDPNVQKTKTIVKLLQKSPTQTIHNERTFSLAILSLSISQNPQKYPLISYYLRGQTIEFQDAILFWRPWLFQRAEKFLKKVENRLLVELWFDSHLPPVTTDTELLERVKDGFECEQIIKAMKTQLFLEDKLTTFISPVGTQWCDYEIDAILNAFHEFGAAISSYSVHSFQAKVGILSKSSTEVLQYGSSVLVTMKTTDPVKTPWGTTIDQVKIDRCKRGIAINNALRHAVDAMLTGTIPEILNEIGISLTDCSNIFSQLMEHGISLRYEMDLPPVFKNDVTFYTLLRRIAGDGAANSQTYIDEYKPSMELLSRVAALDKQKHMLIAQKKKQKRNTYQDRQVQGKLPRGVLDPREIAMQMNPDFIQSLHPGQSQAQQQQQQQQQVNQPLPIPIMPKQVPVPILAPMPKLEPTPAVVHQKTEIPMPITNMSSMKLVPAFNQEGIKLPLKKKPVVHN